MEYEGKLETVVKDGTNTTMYEPFFIQVDLSLGFQFLILPHQVPFGQKWNA